MAVLQVAFTSAAFLLTIAGFQKWRAPQPVSRALQIAGLPHRVVVVRALAAIELSIAALAFTVHHPLAPLVLAGLYFAFAAFVVYALARGLPLESCGCFGRADARPAPGHAGLDAALATMAVIVAVDDVEPLRVLLADDTARGIAVLVVAAVLAALAAAWLRGSFTSSGTRATRSYRALR
jgi:hypothetical protein